MDVKYLLNDLIKSEIAEYESVHGKTYSSHALRSRIKITLIGTVLLFICGFIRYIGIDADYSGVLLTLVLIAVPLILFIISKVQSHAGKIAKIFGCVCLVAFVHLSPAFMVITAIVFLIVVISRKKENAIYKLAAASPDTDIRDIVASDLQVKDSLGAILKSACSVPAIIIGALLLSLILFTVWETEYIYEPYKDGYILMSYKQAFDDENITITIPETVDGYTVIALDGGAFEGCKMLESIVLPDTVTEIGGDCFKDCINLKSITIPSGVTEIRGNTFENCSSLESVIMHDGITAIHGSAFLNCSSLDNVILPANITEIRGNTFENCTSLTSIHIPSGVTRIAAHAFYGCYSLENVFVPDTVTEIGSSAFRKCNNLDTISVPKGVIINERAFKESPTKIEYKVIPDDKRDEIYAELDDLGIEYLYVIYDKEKGSDEIFESPIYENCIHIVNSDKYTSKLASYMTLYEFKDNSDLITYLKKAKSQGIVSVVYSAYSPMASEIARRDYFVNNMHDIDSFISNFEE